MYTSLIEYAAIANDVYRSPTSRSEQIGSDKVNMYDANPDSALKGLAEQSIDGLIDHLAVSTPSNAQIERLSHFHREYINPSNAITDAALAGLENSRNAAIATARHLKQIPPVPTLSSPILNPLASVDDKWLTGWQCLYDYQLEDNSDGFFARLYGNHLTGDTVIAYRGTDWFKLDNLEADIRLWKRLPSPMLKKAKDFYHDAISFLTNSKDTAIQNLSRYSKFPNLTGHSLGGYLAQYVAYEYTKSLIKETIVFNSPKIGGLRGFNPAVGPIDPLIASARTNIINYDIDYDEIHQVGTPIGIQHILHGSYSCSPESYTRIADYQRHPSLGSYYAGSGGTAGNLARAIACIASQHAMLNLEEKIAHMPSLPVDGIASRPAFR